MKFYPSEFIDYSNFNSSLESLTLYWKYSSEDGPFSQFNLNNEFGNSYIGYFPVLSPNNSIDYYILATNSNGKSISHPNAGWHTFETKSFIYGDLNSDGIININDIVLLINIILAIDDFDIAGDLNNDGVINVIDVVQIVSIILS